MHKQNVYLKPYHLRIFESDLFDLNGNFLSEEKIFHLLPDKR